MYQELKKIAVACFCSGVLCYTIALYCAPSFWWLGLIAGILSGYLGYELRAIYQAVPKAMRATNQKLPTILTNCKRWCAQPHPILLFVLIATLPSTYFTVETFISDNFATLTTPQGIFIIILVSIMTPFLLFLFGLLYFGAFILLAGLGSEKAEGCYFKIGRDHEEVLQKKGMPEKPLTYSNAARWFIKGIELCLHFFIWPFWKQLAIGVGQFCCDIGYFFLRLLQLIHCQNRLICAVYGPLGGIIGYFYLTAPHMTLSAYITVTIFSGLISACLGVVARKVLSRLLFRDKAATTT